MRLQQCVLFQPFFLNKKELIELCCNFLEEEEEELRCNGNVGQSNHCQYQPVRGVATLTLCSYQIHSILFVMEISFS
jgi:hypothetical protein